MLHFGYQEEPLLRTPPPSLQTQAVSRWRPLLPVRVISSLGHSRLFLRALLDPGSDDTVFPLDLAQLLGIDLLPDSGHAVGWRGGRHPLRFGNVELEIFDPHSVWRWRAIIGFTAAPIRYPLLGNAGCLEFFDATFKGHERVVELKQNTAFAGITP